MASAIVSGYVKLVQNDPTSINKVPDRYLAEVKAELQKEGE